MTDMTRTWNNAGVTFAAIKLNVTDTASAAASLLVDLQVAATSKFSVTKAGLVTAASDVNATGNLSGANLSVNATGYLNFSGRALIKSPADGSHRLSNQASSSYTSLLLATGASTDIGWYVGAGSPESAVTARVGSFYSRTDGGAVTSFYVKESGTGNTGWVAK